MKDLEGVDERLARLGHATSGILAPKGLDERILAAIAARERVFGVRWDVVWPSTCRAVVASLCACVASVALALHYDATLVTTLASAEDGGTEVTLGDP
jgi:hypothetical protein